MQLSESAHAEKARDRLIYVSPADLRSFVRDLFVRLGTPGDRAEIVADVLVAADESGVRSHGVEYNIRDVYVPGILARSINPDPSIRIVRQDAATGLIDGDRGLGHIVAHEAMSMAIAQASTTGISAIAVRNSTHFGMAGYYSQMAANVGMLGLALTNAPARVLPTFGMVPMLGTNPIAFAAPAVESLLNVDFATSTVSATRLTAERRDRKRLPKSWGADAAGSPTSNPQRVNALLPLGGAGTDDGGHKGFGLGLIVDVLAGLLSGAGHSAALQRPIVGHFFLAIDIERFQPLEEFIRLEQAMASDLRSSPAIAGGRVRVPGDQEFDSHTRAAASGIPLQLETFEDLQTLARAHGISGLKV